MTTTIDGIHGFNGMDYLTLFSLLFHFPSFPFDFRPWSLFLAFPLELILVNPSPSFFFPAPSSSISIAIPASASSYPWPVAEDIHTLSPLQAPLLSYLSSSPFLRPQKARPTTLLKPPAGSRHDNFSPALRCWASPLPSNPPCLAVYQHACDCDLDLTCFSAPHRAGPSFRPHNDVILNIGLIKAVDSFPRRRLSDRNLSSYRDNSLHEFCLA
ncbi:Dothistromin biosynthesis peroxidase dotB [Fusarium oxysporum f. sp. albedinis]|nr:Dothistromin biosynthesis peroxidase dotB [Fusarium oxysporum f. sp. albedinis]